MSNCGFFVFLIYFLSLTNGECSRRIGKLNTQTWKAHQDFGMNLSNFKVSPNYPDLSAVGLLESRLGIIGTATLIAPNIFVTAAHVVRNSVSDPLPLGGDWKFVLADDFDKANSSQIHSISKFELHPAWIIRQAKGINKGFGDGDRIGVDLCLGFLEKNIYDIYPFPFASSQVEPLGGRVVVAGFGTQVDGANGVLISSNSQRLAGENI